MGLFSSSILDDIWSTNKLACQAQDHVESSTHYSCLLEGQYEYVFMDVYYRHYTRHDFRRRRCGRGFEVIWVTWVLVRLSLDRGYDELKAR